MESHGDDTFMIGEHQDVRDAASMMTAEFTCNVGPVIGFASEGGMVDVRELGKPLWYDGS